MRIRYLARLIALIILPVLTACSLSESTMTPSPDSQFISVDGVRLHHVITGPETAPVILVLHGASANLFEPHMALETALADYRVIWLDRPGLGWSERPSGAWTPEREADLIAAFLTQMQIDRATLIGHSWGAAISLRLMMDHPDRTQGAVLVGPALRAWVGDAALYNKLTGWPVLGPLITHVIAPWIGPNQMVQGVASAFSPEPVPEDYIETTRLNRLFAPSVWRANASDMARVNHALADQEERYGDIGQPVILIAGPGDTVVRTSRHAEPVAEALPRGELRLIEGAGHNPHHAHADAVAQALADVLAATR